MEFRSQFFFSFSFSNKPLAYSTSTLFHHKHTNYKAIVFNAIILINNIIKDILVLEVIYFSKLRSFFQLHVYELCVRKNQNKIVIIRIYFNCFQFFFLSVNLGRYLNV